MENMALLFKFRFVLLCEVGSFFIFYWGFRERGMFRVRERGLDILL